MNLADDDMFYGEQLANTIGKFLKEQFKIMITSKHVFYLEQLQNGSRWYVHIIIFCCTFNKSITCYYRTLNATL